MIQYKYIKSILIYYAYSNTIHITTADFVPPKPE